MNPHEANKTTSGMQSGPDRREFGKLALTGTLAPRHYSDRGSRARPWCTQQARDQAVCPVFRQTDR